MRLDVLEIDNNRRNSEGLLVKLSCHDSGIDIRDPPPVVPQIPRKAVYSDADVLLSDDFVPPVPIQPLRPSDDAETRRKKTSSVSFSLEEGEDVVPLREKDDAEKETKKNKVNAGNTKYFYIKTPILVCDDKSSRLR